MYSIAGEDIIKLLSFIEPDLANSVFSGCGLDDGVAEELYLITSVDFNNKNIECELDGKRRQISFNALRTMIIEDNLPNLPLKAAFLGNKTPFEHNIDEAKDILRSFGIKVSKIANNGDILELADIFKNHKLSVLPDIKTRFANYELLKRIKLYREGAEIVGLWREQSEKNGGAKKPDIYIKLSYLLRHSKRLDEAIRTTEVIHLPKKYFLASSAQIAILSLQRAAILMDLYEQQKNPDKSLLIQARKLAGKAWSIDDENNAAFKIYGRLKCLENQVRDVEAEIQRNKSFRAIGDPNNKKANKPYSEH